MRDLGLGSLLAAGLLATSSRGASAAPQIAVALNDTGSAVVFDMSTDTVVGSVPVASNVYDCSLDARTNLAYVSDFAQHLWVVDAGAMPPALAAGTNPIDSSTATEDTALTPDGRFLIACDGSLSDPISVVDIASRTEVSTFSLAGGCQGVEVCDDGSVLVTQYDFPGDVRRFSIDSSGTLTDTGEVLSAQALNNIACGKGGQTGALITSGSIISFKIPGLIPVDTRSLSGFLGNSVVVNGAGNRLYARGNAFVDAFDFDSATGAIGAMPLWSIFAASAPGYYGVDQLALNVAGTKLYVSEGGAISVHDAVTGASIGTITDPSIVRAVGLCAPTSTCGDGAQEGGEACDDGNLDDGDGCDSNCTLTGCGNGIVTDGEQCDDGNTVDGDCCSNSCTPAPDGTTCDDNRFCNGADTCSAGACTAHAGDPCSGGAECNDSCSEVNDNCFTAFGASCTDDGNVCTTDECDGAGACTHPPTFAVCDDGVFCNGQDFCFAGTCDSHTGDPCSFTPCNAGCDEPTAQCIAASSGTACFDDGNECTHDECDGTGLCLHPPGPTGAPCASDFNGCTSDQCNASGFCAHPPLPTTTACPTDGNSCTSDHCSGFGACIHPPVPDGSPCNDPNGCTQTDECESGQCIGTDPIVCPSQPCRAPNACDPGTGTCSSCPAGYSSGGGGCQKRYAIGVSLLDNLSSTCGDLQQSRYNDCIDPFGFHWTDTADDTVGPVARVDVQFRQGVDCDFADHQVSLNATDVGTYPKTNTCTCQPTPVPRTLANLPVAAYLKGGDNAIEVSAQECTGLSRDLQGNYAVVTVTYGAPGALAAIRDDCRAAMKSTLKYSNDANDAQDVVKWKWAHGAATTLVDLANPTDAADYEFCVFAAGTGTASVVIAADVPADPASWKLIGHKGFQYKDTSGAEDGISRIIAKGGPDGKAKISLKGKGQQLDDPALPLSAETSSIRVQLTNKSSDVCWESVFPYGTARVNADGIKGNVP